MSQIATAYGLPSESLPALRNCLDDGDHEGFWQQLRPLEIGAAFSFSGYVVVVLGEFLRENEIEIPLSHDADVQFLVDQCDPMVCASPPEAASFAGALGKFKTTDEELADYWHDFTGDEEPGSSDAMRAALDWLTQALVAGQARDWCVVLVS